MKAITDVMGRIARDAGMRALAAQKSAQIAVTKAPGDFATQVDIATEEFIKEELAREFPGTAVYGEESATGDILPNPSFIVDPIDGTRNFALQGDAWGTTIGFFQDGRPRVGVIHLPATDALFVGEVGKGASVNSRPVKLTDNPLQFPTRVGFGGWEEYVGAGDRFGADLGWQISVKIGSLRSACSAVVDASDVLLSQTEGFIHLGGKSWDFCGAAAIVEAAGGRVVSLHGDELKWQRRMIDGIVFGKPTIVNALVSIASPAVRRSI